MAKLLEAALDFSRSLEAQHAHAQSTISALEAKVSSLRLLANATRNQVACQAEIAEQLVQTSKAARAAPPPVPVTVLEVARREERESLTAMFSEWKSVERKWSSVQEDWREERERLWRAQDEWERQRHARVGPRGNRVDRPAR